MPDEEEKTPEELAAEEAAKIEKDGQLELEVAPEKGEEGKDKKSKKGEKKEEMVPLSRLKRIDAERKTLRARVAELEKSPVEDKPPAGLTEAELAELATDPGKLIERKAREIIREENDATALERAREDFENLPIAKKDPQFMEHIDSIAARFPGIKRLPVREMKKVYLAIYENEVAQDLVGDNGKPGNETLTKRGLSPSPSASSRKVVTPGDIDKMSDTERNQVWEKLGATPAR